MITERRLLGAAGLATALAAALILFRFPWIVGPPSWRWTFQATPLWPDALVTVALFGMIALLLRAWSREPESIGARREALYAGALVVLALLLELSLLGLSPLGLATLPLIHVVPWVTGYFWTARSVVSLDEMLATYPDLVAQLPHHARTHPPGLVALNWILLSFFRGSAGATDMVLACARPAGLTPGRIPAPSPAELATLIVAGGLVVLASRAAIIPAYLLARRLAGVATARTAALLLAIIPSSLLFAGEFDTAFPLLVMSALLLVGRGRRAPALLAAGALAGVLCLFTFVATFFLLLCGVVDLFQSEARSFRERVPRLVLLGIGFAIPLALFEIATGCSIPRVFLAAYTIQQEVLIPEQKRQWLTWVFWNLQDFFLFLGPALGMLFAASGARVLRAWRRGAVRAATPEAFVLSLLLFLALVDLSGLIPAETSRVWQFLVAPVVIAAAHAALPLGRRGLFLVLGLQLAFALVAKGSILMIDVKLPDAGG